METHTFQTALSPPTGDLSADWLRFQPKLLQSFGNPRKVLLAPGERHRPKGMSAQPAVHLPEKTVGARQLRSPGNF